MSFLKPLKRLRIICMSKLQKMTKKIQEVVGAVEKLCLLIERLVILQESKEKGSGSGFLEIWVRLVFWRAIALALIVFIVLVFLVFCF